MSDISVLSNQYDKLVSTSEKVNNSVIAFKKKSILNDDANKTKYPKLKITAEELNMAKSILVLFLENIQKLLEDEYMESDFIPVTVLEDYKQRLSVNPYLKEDLKKLLELLKQNQPVGEENITVLDSILLILDNERSSLFKKLRTARG
ncbi:hypothetical protein BH11BAC3_BH11BAC3_01960 [soil metagenome]